MKKKFKMEDLDCANCAAKMENGISKIPGVSDISVSFLTQKLMLEADDDKFDDVLEQAIKIIKKVNSDTRIII